MDDDVRRLTTLRNTVATYSTPCDRCGLAAGIEGLVPDGKWPDGSRRYAHPSCQNGEVSDGD